MIFDNIIYPDNKKKEEKIKELEVDLENLFENYKNAWNNFCEQIKMEDKVPKLITSIKANSIEECLEDIDNATKKINEVIDNISEKLEAKKLKGEMDYELSQLQTEDIIQAIKYSSVAIGLGGGLFILYLTYRKIKDAIKAYQYAGRAKDAAYNVQVTKDILRIRANTSYKIKEMFNIEYEGIARFISKCQNEGFINIDGAINLEFREIYINTYGKLDKLAYSLSNHLEVNGAQSVREEICQAVYEQSKKVHNILKTITKNYTMGDTRIKDFYRFPNIERDMSKINAMHEKYLYLHDEFKKPFVENKIYSEIHLENSTKAIKNLEVVKNEYRNNCSIECEIKSSSIITTVIGVVIVIAVVLVVDAITSCIEGMIRRKELNERIEQMNNILGDLTKAMKKETKKLIELTQSLRDGVIWIDKKYMMLVDKETSETTLVKVADIK
ncbi:MAG: hypothetical protein ACRCSG_05180 [Cellulosilyticaceae bacterium]